MAELRELQKKLESVGGLREVVNAMRNLAAVYVRRAEAALEATRPYAEVVETALHVVLKQPGVPEAGVGDDRRCLAVVFASDQGLCGTYNERVVRAAVAFREQAGFPVEFTAIGIRARDQLILRGIQPIAGVHAPTSIEGIRARVPELAADIFDSFSQLDATEMTFVYNVYTGMGRFREEVRPVLPPRRDHLQATRQNMFRYEPLLTMPPDELLGELIEEYFFVQLYRALLESHSSESGARLLAMTAASSNIDDRFAELTKDYQTVRQDAITAELLDVVGGAEALRSGSGEEIRGRG